MSHKNLDDLIEEATIDCYDDQESRVGFLTMIQDNLVVPFSAILRGKTVTITEIDGDDRVIKAFIKGGDKIFSVDVLDLAINRNVKGSEWIAAYKKWENRR